MAFFTLFTIPLFVVLRIQGELHNTNIATVDLEAASGTTPSGRASSFEDETLHSKRRISSTSAAPEQEGHTENPAIPTLLGGSPEVVRLMPKTGQTAVAGHYPPIPIFDSAHQRSESRGVQKRIQADGTEELLYKTLLNPERYEKDVRPTLNHQKPTNVTFGFLLNQIVEMDERNQVLTTRSWLNVNWMDPRLVWNASLWAGIKTLYVPHQRIWKPDIILVNNAIREYHASLVSTDIMTTSDGNVTWLFSAIFKSSCRIRVRYYPFDDQECDLKFASWSHDSREIDLGLTTDKGDLSSYMNNSEFDLIDMLAIREVSTLKSKEFQFAGGELSIESDPELANHRHSHQHAATTSLLRLQSRERNS